jgi:hypothetical protein
VQLALATLFATAFFAILLFIRFQPSFTFRSRYAWLAAALFLAILQTACGGGGGGSTTTPPESGSQTYTVTVTGTSTTANSVKIVHAATITVTVP